MGMAYAAVSSLKQTINGVLNSCRISFISSTRETLELAYKETASLQEVVETLYERSSERLGALDGQIRDAAHELEDVLEFHELYSQDEDEVVRKAITSFAGAVKKMEEEYIEELSKTALVPLPQHHHAADIDFGVEMVGRSNEFNAIRDRLLGRLMSRDLCFFLFLGKLGCGRSMVAHTIFEDLRMANQFVCYAWVTLGSTTTYQIKDVLMQILAQVDRYHDTSLHPDLIDEEAVCNYLCQVLENRSYMIVLDDVPDMKVVEYLRSSLPNRSDGSVVFVTSGLEGIDLTIELCMILDKPLRNLEQAFWETLRVLMFGEDRISPELEEAGKKIIKNCGGLRIAAAKLFLFLHKTDKTLDKWREIASDEENPIFMVRDEILEMSDIKTEMQSYNWDMNDTLESLIHEMILLTAYGQGVEEIKQAMQPERFFPKMQIISLLGMAGIGKSTLARNIFKDELILCHFDHHAWVTLGPKYQTKEVLIDILAQIYPSINKMQMKGDEELALELCIRLSGKRCLIVLDDICSQEPLHHLKNAIPYTMGSILVTTRLAEVAKFKKDDHCIKMELLDKEESWYLFRQKVFPEGMCPHELEKAGRKIVKKCEGHPLLILTVADQLLKVDKVVEYWNNVASGKEKLVFKKAHDAISKALLPSYQSLPQHLKACFLYLGVFRNDYKIPLSKLTNLLIAEGFLKPNSPQSIQDFIEECLSELVGRSLIMVYQSTVSDLRIKTCRLHPIFWHLSNSEAVKNKFFHAMNDYADCSIESIRSQRRLCIRNSILLAMKDVRDSIAYITTTHSLLCVGPPHQYPVPISFDWRLLRVMDALTIRLYEFPVEVVKLINLRYLGLTCNGNLPTSISDLWKLQFLIVRRYMNIKSSKNSSPLPSEIWDMKELIHLQVMGGHLSDHKCGTGLLKLATLLEVSAESCTKEILEMIPNLKRLGIRIELAQDDNCNPFHYLSNVHRLGGLESLKCMVVNPRITSEFDPPPPPSFVFPASLKKLSLSGTRYPWEYMSIICQLQNLQVLKLKHYAFEGPKWIMDHGSKFNELQFLLVQDTNLGNWEAELPVFMELKRLTIKHCYKLKEIPGCLPFHEMSKLEIIDCHPLVVDWVEDMKDFLVVNGCEVKIHLSWNGDSREED